jgi:hypothetical protein
MRHCVLALAIASTPACFINLDDDDDDDGAGTGDTSGDASASSASGTTSPSGTSEAPSSTSPSDTAPSDDTSDSSDSSTMTGCEGGPLSAPIPGCAPTPPASTGDFGQDCVDRINQFRWECQCLPPLARWADAEACTDEQSGNDQNGGGAHGNFGACGEWAQNTCPNWGSESDIIGGCLQAMWDEGPGEPFEAHGHYINMSSLDYTKVACGYSSGGEGLWSNQNFGS